MGATGPNGSDSWVDILRHSAYTILATFSQSLHPSSISRGSASPLRYTAENGHLSPLPLAIFNQSWCLVLTGSVFLAAEAGSRPVSICSRAIPSSFRIQTI